MVTGTILLLFLLLTENMLQQNARRSFLDLFGLVTARAAEAPSEGKPQSVASDRTEVEPQSVTPDEPAGEPQSAAPDRTAGEPHNVESDEPEAGTQGAADGRTSEDGTEVRVPIVMAGMIILIIGIGVFSKRKDAK